MGYNDPLIESMAASTGLALMHESKRPGSPGATRRPGSSDRAMFTTLDLPSAYDDAPLATRLWLQSRLGSDGKISEEPCVRSITVANTGIQLDLCRLMWPRCWGMLRRERRRLGPGILAWGLEVLLNGVMFSAQLWADSRLLDLVESSFRGAPASWGTALGAAGFAVGMVVFNRIRDRVFASATDYLTEYVNYQGEKAYMKMQLGLDLQTSSNPLHMALVSEAGVLTGNVDLEHDYYTYSGPCWWQLKIVGSVVSDLIELGTQVAVIVRTLALSSPDARITPGNIVLVGLSLAPTLLDLLQEKLGEWLDPYGDTSGAATRRNAEVESSTLRELAYSPNKQELVIFGFKDWLLQRWDKLKVMQLTAQRTSQYERESIMVVVNILEEVIKNGFYVLLATRAVPTTLSLGALTLHKQMAEQLLNSYRSFVADFHLAYQLPFLLTAFFAAEDGPRKLGPQLNYEDYRPQGRGMRIEACDLSFTYPGASKPALHGISFVVEPGECLAIVGFNGGGKTTLVKTLMGLQRHSGTLRINDHDIDDYNAETMHKRMSCLFQDYARHMLSLRANVGMGYASRMADDAAIMRALARGGGSEVCAEVGGLERWLNPNASSSTTAQPKPARAQSRPARHAGSDVDSDVDAEPLSGSDIIVSLYDRAAPLSGGQWQRVAIARAFMCADSADLVVFDEPSASLDPRAEAELFDRIHALSMRDGKRVTTTVFISHRFSTVRRADKIAFMENGTITEFGTHDELMAKGGQYCEMFELQRSGFDG